MTGLDYGLLAVIGLSALVGMVRGLLREVLSLLVWIASIWVALRYVDLASVQLESWVDSPTLRLGLAFAGLFMLALSVGGLINFLLGKLVEKTGLSTADRFLGLLFGTARGIAIIILAVLLATLTPMPREHWWQSSVLIPGFERAVAQVRDLIPADLRERFLFPDEQQKDETQQDTTQASEAAT